MTSATPEIPPPVSIGFMTDRQIRAALATGQLIEKGTWDEAGIRHASYTLRLGHRVELERNGAASGEREQKKITLTNGGAPLELRPGDTAMLFSIENLRLPASVLGFTVARGLLFVEALVPENTYVDPGFTGQLYTTVTNLSGRVLKLPYGTPIARLFFYRLGEDVHQSYQTGPAIGVPQHVESVPGVAFPTTEKAHSARVADLYRDLVATERGGARTAELLKRNHRFARLAFLTAVFWPGALVTGIQWLQDSNGFVVGVASSVVASLLIIGAEKMWQRITEAG